MTTVRAARSVVLAPREAQALWLDLSRWPTFIEGFGHVKSGAEEWPAEGTKLVWQSQPGGRGLVTEKVNEHGEGHISTRLLEDSMTGFQSISFESDGEGGTIVELCLKYDLNPTTVWRQGPLGAVVNVLFIRRAITDSLTRTLRRFATEAAEQQAL